MSFRLEALESTAQEYICICQVPEYQQSLVGDIRLQSSDAVLPEPDATPASLAYHMRLGYPTPQDKSVTGTMVRDVEVSRAQAVSLEKTHRGYASALEVSQPCLNTENMVVQK